MSSAAALALQPDPALAAIYTFREPSAGQPLPRLVRRMLGLFDGTRSLAAVCTAVQIPEDQGLAIVRKLSSLGLIAPRTRGEQDRTSLSGFERGDTIRGMPAPAGTPALAGLSTRGFTAVEEAFFASEVLPGEEEPDRSFGEKLSLYISDLILRLRGAAL